jgi:hypothetical protein
MGESAADSAGYAQWTLNGQAASFVKPDRND